MLSLVLAAALASAPLEPPAWHDGLDWHGVHVGIQRDAQDTYTLEWPFGQRVVAPQAFKVDTASALFDGLYAMAQDDLRQDSVSAIRDGAFDHGAPIPCHCFETGLKWPYVWTRDLSYAIDLGLWRFDGARARNGLDHFSTTLEQLDAGRGSEHAAASAAEPRRARPEAPGRPRCRIGRHRRGGGGPSSRAICVNRHRFIETSFFARRYPSASPSGRRGVAAERGAGRDRSGRNGRIFLSQSGPAARMVPLAPTRTSGAG